MIEADALGGEGLVEVDALPAREVSTVHFEFFAAAGLELDAPSVRGGCDGEKEPGGDDRDLHCCRAIDLSICIRFRVVIVFFRKEVS